MNKIKKITLIILVGMVGLLVVGFVVMGLWNWLVPVLFNGAQISFWQALGLFALAKILFGGGWGGRGRCGGRHKWNNRYYEKFSSMSPEERERFKQKMREKWCSPGGKDTPPKASSNV